MADTATASPTAEEIFLHRLKDSTISLHRNLEQSAVSSVLMSPAITAKDYAIYLAAMREIVTWCESVLFRLVMPVIPNIASRRKLDAIDRDLKTLTLIAPVTVPPFLPLPSSLLLSKALGFVYVVEGSTLGGMVILKQLQQQPFLTAETSHFLTVYGKNTGPYWKTFLHTLSTFAVNNSMEDEIIEGAKETFQAIDNYFGSISAGK